MTEVGVAFKKLTDAVRGFKHKPDKATYNSEAARFPPNQVLHNSKGQQLSGEPRLLKKREVKHLLGHNWSWLRKWYVLTVIFIVQVSMNFNASVYGNANSGLSEEFNVSYQVGRSGQASFLIAYAIGSELWAPWSEELGRWPILQASLFLVNIFQIPVALSGNIVGVIIGRALGGLSSAGGSVTLGMVNDLYDVDHQGYAVNYIVLSSVGGSVVGPIVGAFIEANMNWRWVFWISLFFGLAVQALHLFVPETSPHILLAREARRRREELGENVWGEDELKAGITFRGCLRIWYRPFRMLATEPIVLCLSLLSGFSDALIFTFIEAFTPVYAQYNFSIVQTGLSFIPLLVGYFLAFLWFLPFIRRDNMKRDRKPGSVQPESRLVGLLYTAPLLSGGLFIFAWTSLGPSYNIPWIAPMIASAMIGIANAAIYMATIDYMIAAYGPYAASATGGNAFARDGLSGIAAWYSAPFYSYFKEPYTLSYPSTILACIAFFFTIPIYVFYIFGPQIRERSKFAMTLAGNAKTEEEGEATETPEEKRSFQDQETGGHKVENALEGSSTDASTDIDYRERP